MEQYLLLYLRKGWYCKVIHPLFSSFIPHPLSLFPYSSSLVHNPSALVPNPHSHPSPMAPYSLPLTCNPSSLSIQPSPFITHPSCFQKVFSIRSVQLWNLDKQVFQDCWQYSSIFAKFLLWISRKSSLTFVNICKPTAGSGYKLVIRIQIRQNIIGFYTKCIRCNLLPVLM